MRVFLDFEASSLKKNGFPIEIGWAFEDGRGENWLIRPAPGWTDWDPKAEAIHGIPRETLEREGTPHDQVAARMVETLSGLQLFASAPSWDGKWLSLLLRSAGFPRHTLRLRDTEEAQHESAWAILAPVAGPEEAERIARELMVQVRAEGEARPVRHRALADAEEELRRWRDIRRLAEEAAARFG
ncbi:MAG TPA: transcriptional regulator [Allosphingosinicella sp.]|jgi:hypothetical protein